MSRKTHKTQNSIITIVITIPSGNPEHVGFIYTWLPRETHPHVDYGSSCFDDGQQANSTLINCAA